jgi:transposase
MEEVAAASEIERSNERRHEPRSSALTDQIDFRVRRERHRRWRPDERLRIVEETLQSGTVIAEVARRHGIGTGLLYTWRKEMLTTAMAGLVPVHVQAGEPNVMPTPMSKPASRNPTTRLTGPAGRIEVEFPNGIRVRIDGGADEAVLRSVLTALGGD